METVTRNLTNYIFFIIQFITITALAAVNKINNVGEVLFVTALFVGYISLERKYSLGVNNYIHICLALVIIAHCYGGKYLNLYSRSAGFDNYLHVFGTYAVTLLAYVVIENFLNISFNSRASSFLYIVLLGLSIGAIYELMEFAVDVTINPPIHNQPSLLDTNLDMISDLIGSLVAAFHVSFMGITRRKNVLHKE